jgi:hypothetical protein
MLAVVMPVFTTASFTTFMVGMAITEGQVWACGLVSTPFREDGGHRRHR